MEQLLKQFDFSDEEILVYRTLLKLGGARVSEIAKATELKRTTVQEYIRSIEEKGFINSSKLGNKYFYQAEDPDRFRQIINERLFVVDRLIPELRRTPREDVWQARTLTLEEKRLKLKRARKKKLPMAEFGDDKIGGAIVGNREVILFSTNEEIPAIEIKSEAIAKFHKDLVTPKSSAT